MRAFLVPENLVTLAGGKTGDVGYCCEVIAVVGKQFNLFAVLITDKCIVLVVDYGSIFFSFSNRIHLRFFGKMNPSRFFL